MKAIAMSAVLAASALGSSQAQTWTRVTPNSTPPALLGASLLLTDGTVMVHDDLGNPRNWWRLTPDAKGSYVNGTWKLAAPMPSGYGPYLFGSSVIPDGRLLVAGGVENLGAAAFSTQGAVYDPAADTWTSVTPPVGWEAIGNGYQLVLDDGKVLQASCCSDPKYHLAYFNPTSLNWTPTDVNQTKADTYSDEPFTLLPNGKVLVVDGAFAKDTPGTTAELFDETSGTWSPTASTPVALFSGDRTFGPSLLRPDGTVLEAGLRSAIFHTQTSTWTTGPAYPTGVTIGNGPAALEPNGNVLLMGQSIYGAPATFLEFNGTAYTTVVGPPRANVDPSSSGRMLELPTGQILFTDLSGDVEVFTPADRQAEAAWKPELKSYPLLLAKGRTAELKGLRLAGMSAGASYGPSNQSATNYGLVRLTNLQTGRVLYAKTHDASSYAVQSTAEQTTRFDVPAATPVGIYTIEVVTNGIASAKGLALVL